MLVCGLLVGKSKQAAKECFEKAFGPKEGVDYFGYCAWIETKLPESLFVTHTKQEWVYVTCVEIESNSVALRKLGKLLDRIPYGEFGYVAGRMRLSCATPRFLHIDPA